MKMASLHITAVAILLSGVTMAMMPQSITPDLQVEYFADANITCDSITLNISQRWSEIESMRWMLPDATLITESTKDIQVHKSQITFPYRLTISRIKDDLFGYYTCIVVFKSPVVNQINEVRVVRWGVNIDGPDFSRLREEYAQHAITGAIAGGALLGILGLTCIIWHYRYSTRHRHEIESKYGVGSSKEYHNRAYDDIDIETIKSPDQPNGSSSHKIDTEEINEKM